MKVQTRDAKKIYVVDTGLRNANASSRQEDIGKLAENLVYIHLRRQGKEITYFKEKGEVDFVVTTFGKPTEALQVCYDNLQHEETWRRETESLIECLNVLDLAEGTILTLSREESQTIDGKAIHLIPLFRWLLE